MIAHEVGHVAAGHVSYLRLLFTNLLAQVPLLGTAYSRSQEYTADNFGYLHAPAGAPGVMAVLAAGKYLNADVNVNELADRAAHEKGLWVHIANWQSSHPVTTWRTHALRDRRRPGHLWFRPGLRGTPGASYRRTAASGQRRLAGVPDPGRRADPAGSRGGGAAGRLRPAVRSVPRGRLHRLADHASDPAVGAVAVPGLAPARPRSPCLPSSTSPPPPAGASQLRRCCSTRAVGCCARLCTSRVRFPPRSGDLVSGRRVSSRRRPRGRDDARCRPRPTPVPHGDAVQVDPAAGQGGILDVGPAHGRGARRDLGRRRLPAAQPGDRVRAVDRLGAEPVGERGPGRATVAGDLQGERIARLGVDELLPAQPDRPRRRRDSGTVRVAVRAFAVPENQAVRPSRGRTARDSARPCAAATRAGLTDPHDRDGCTRLLSKITKDREAKSITSEVPV